MTENLFTPDCIRTFSGLYVNVFDPKPEMFCIEDIAHALSHQPRFSGHLKEFYTVAQHSYHCSRSVAQEHAYTALMHDCSEAYLLDMPSPIKARMPEYKAVEDNLMKTLAEVFQFQYPIPVEVKSIDRDMLVIEWDHFMIGDPKAQFLPCFSPARSKRMFITQYKELRK
jgi:hypothetical protein